MDIVALEKKGFRKLPRQLQKFYSKSVQQMNNQTWFLDPSIFNKK